MLYFSVFFSVISFVMTTYTPEYVFVKLNPLWAVIVGGIYVYLAATKYHDKAHDVSGPSSEARALTASVKDVQPPLGTEAVG